MANNQLVRQNKTWTKIYKEGKVNNTLMKLIGLRQIITTEGEEQKEEV